MANYLKSKSLNAQIKDTEQRIANRQRKIAACTAILVEKVQQKQKLVVTPATLLLAGSIGFIIAELTKYPAQKLPSNANKRGVVETALLRVALNLNLAIIQLKSGKL
jgi:hypothetical protein